MVNTVGATLQSLYILVYFFFSAEKVGGLVPKIKTPKAVSLILSPPPLANETPWPRSPSAKLALKGRLLLTSEFY